MTIANTSFFRLFLKVKVEVEGRSSSCRRPRSSLSASQGGSTSIRLFLREAVIAKKIPVFNQEITRALFSYI